MLRERLARLFVVAATAVMAACGHSASNGPGGGPGAGEAAAPFAGRPGDLGTGNAAIDHSGPNGGVVGGAAQSGSAGAAWQPAGCPGTVPVATGVTDAARGQEAYGSTDMSPHAVHTIPTMTVHGNHEEMATGYFALFALPGIEEIYGFDWGDVHFVVLNDTPNGGDADLTGRQAAFLDQDLTAAQARPMPPAWIVTSHHRPMFSSDPEGSNTTVRAAWQPSTRSTTRTSTSTGTLTTTSRRWPGRRRRRRGRDPLRHVRRGGRGVRPDERRHGQPLDGRVLLGSRAGGRRRDDPHDEDPGLPRRRNGDRGEPDRVAEVRARAATRPSTGDERGGARCQPSKPATARG
jgi:hypothetical protein